MKFRKKPVVIDAVQFTGESLTLEDGATLMASMPWRPDGSTPSPVLLINTLEGTMVADVGDWIITGVRGEHYPCKPDIFAATYEPAVDKARADGVNE